MRTLYPYQKKGVEYIKSTQHPAVFWDMRLGKTKITITALKDFKGRRLIVCPKTVIGTWQDELELEGITDYAYYTSSHLKKWFNKHTQLPKWVVMNYEAVQKLSEKEQELFQCVILDESVRVKSATTKTTKFFCSAFRNVEKRIVLSGNPAPNSPLEYFSQFKFLHNEWMKCDNFYQFRGRYFIGGYNGWIWWPRHGVKEQIKQQVAKDAYVLTRKDVGVANEKIYQKRVIEMPPALAKKYKEMEKEFVTTLPSGKKLETKYILPQLSYLQQLAGGSISGEDVSDFKVKEVVSLLQGELKDESVVIWCRFRWEVDALQKAIKDSVEVITGDTPVEYRSFVQKSFQDGKIKVMISQVSTGKFGINLSKSSTAIYYSNSFVPDDRNQSEYRIEHNSKKEPLLYIDLVAKDTIDEQVLKTLKKKHVQSRYFMGEIVQELKEKYK